MSESSGEEENLSAISPIIALNVHARSLQIKSIDQVVNENRVHDENSSDIIIDYHEIEQICLGLEWSRSELMNQFPVAEDKNYQLETDNARLTQTESSIQKLIFLVQDYRETSSRFLLVRYQTERSNEEGNMETYNFLALSNVSVIGYFQRLKEIYNQIENFMKASENKQKYSSTKLWQRLSDLRDAARKAHKEFRITSLNCDVLNQETYAKDALFANIRNLAPAIGLVNLRHLLSVILNVCSLRELETGPNSWKKTHQLSIDSDLYTLANGRRPTIKNYNQYHQEIEDVLFAACGDETRVNQFDLDVFGGKLRDLITLIFDCSGSDTYIGNESGTLLKHITKYLAINDGAFPVHWKTVIPVYPKRKAGGQSDSLRYIRYFLISCTYTQFEEYLTLMEKRQRQKPGESLDDTKTRLRIVKKIVTLEHLEKLDMKFNPKFSERKQSEKDKSSKALVSPARETQPEIISDPQITNQVELDREVAMALDAQMNREANEQQKLRERELREQELREGELLRQREPGEEELRERLEGLGKKGKDSEQDRQEEQEAEAERNFQSQGEKDLQRKLREEVHKQHGSQGGQRSSNEPHPDTRRRSERLMKAQGLAQPLQRSKSTFDSESPKQPTAKKRKTTKSVLFSAVSTGETRGFSEIFYPPPARTARISTQAGQGTPTQPISDADEEEEFGQITPTSETASTQPYVQFGGPEVIDPAAMPEDVQFGGPEVIDPAAMPEDYLNFSENPAGDELPNTAEQAQNVFEPSSSGSATASQAQDPQSLFPPATAATTHDYSATGSSRAYRLYKPSEPEIYDMRGLLFFGDGKETIQGKIRVIKRFLETCRYAKSDRQLRLETFAPSYTEQELDQFHTECYAARPIPGMEYDLSELNHEKARQNVINSTNLWTEEAHRVQEWGDLLWNFRQYAGVVISNIYELRNLQLQALGFATLDKMIATLFRKLDIPDVIDKSNENYDEGFETELETSTISSALKRRQYRYLTPAQNQMHHCTVYLESHLKSQPSAVFYVIAYELVDYLVKSIATSASEEEKRKFGQVAGMLLNRLGNMRVYLSSFH